MRYAPEFGNSLHLTWMGVADGIPCETSHGVPPTTVMVISLTLW